jgi:hypothetical protein
MAQQAMPLSNKNSAPRTPDVNNPLVVYSPQKGSDENFDPTPLIEVLGKPLKYESAILISYRQIDKPEVVDASWGNVTANPDTDVIATPWIIDQAGQLVPAGKDYPLKKVELDRREATELQDPNGIILLKKPGETSFFRVPSELIGAISIFSPETPSDGMPQVVKENDIIAFTETGPWVMQWDPEKFREV